MITRRKTLAGLAATAATTSALPALSLPEGSPAPDWEIAEWINSEPVQLSDMRGQVVVIDFFQLWCPGCKSFSIPLTLKWEKEFAEEIANDQMKIVSIHTVFEGHRHQTVDRLKKFVTETGFGHPVGHDLHDDTIHDRLPITMIKYGTRGTPEIAIVDKEGRIAFQKIGFFDPEEKAALIRRLLAA
jgi:thiol-disulfide isomerase/thioredoxin